MRFWDTSALVPLLVAESTTKAVRHELASDDGLAVWWGTETGCVSALARVERGGTDISDALERLDMLTRAWLQVEPGDLVRRAATRMLRVHPLRAADALQLAAAGVASEGDPRTLPLVTFDDRLSRAATREGHPVIRPGSGRGHGRGNRRVSSV